MGSNEYFRDNVVKMLTALVAGDAAGGLGFVALANTAGQKATVAVVALRIPTTEELAVNVTAASLSQLRAQGHLTPGKAGERKRVHRRGVTVVRVDGDDE